MNGSPLAHAGDDDDVNGIPSRDPGVNDDDDVEEEGDSDDDLPDPEAYEAKLAKSQRQRAMGKLTTTTTSGPTTSTSIARMKSKRGPSLMFRQSLAPPRTTSNGDVTSNRNGDQEIGNDGLSSISLKDGRIMTFNPLDLYPVRIEEEMRESGMGDQEREVVRSQIKEEVVKALSERMERWSGLR